MDINGLKQQLYEETSYFHKNIYSTVVEKLFHVKKNIIQEKNDYLITHM